VDYKKERRHTMTEELSVRDVLKTLFLTRVEEAKSTAAEIYKNPCMDLNDLKQRMNIIQLLLGSLMGQLEMLMQIEEPVDVTVEDLKLIFTP
jgi:hypothetical protein